MPRAIWKFPLKMTEKQTLAMPAGKVLSVAEQYGQLVLWAEVTPGSVPTAVHVNIIGTGHEFNFHPGRFIGSVQQREGAYVWHVYAADGHEGSYAL